MDFNPETANDILQRIDLEMLQKQKRWLERQPKRKEVTSLLALLTNIEKYLEDTQDLAGRYD